jgi:hypothetical protein
MCTILKRSAGQVGAFATASDHGSLDLKTMDLLIENHGSLDLKTMDLLIENHGSLDLKTQSNKLDPILRLLNVQLQCQRCSWLERFYIGENNFYSKIALCC